MKNVLRFGLVAICLLFAVQVAVADTAAIGLTGFDISGNGQFTVGWAFHVNSTITVTNLGVFDAQGDGLNGAHNVGIWTAGGTLLGSNVVPGGTGGFLDAGFRYA